MTCSDPNNYNTENGSYAKSAKSASPTRSGRLKGMGDWTVSAIGRNLFTFTNYSGYDPEIGVNADRRAQAWSIRSMPSTSRRSAPNTISISARF
jgi:hypothetical protein